MFNFIKSFFSQQKINLKKINQAISLPKRPLSKLDQEIIDCFEFIYGDKITQPLSNSRLQILSALVAIGNVKNYLKFDLDENDENQFYDILFSYFETKDYYTTLKNLEEILLGQTFEWELYDKCVETCDELELYPYFYQYLKKRPKAPTTIKEAAMFLTIPQQKNVLKRKGERNLPKVKESVTELFVQICSLDDCNPEITERLELMEDKFRYVIRREKINGLIRTVITRQEAIVNHYLYSIQSREPIYPCVVQREFSLVRTDNDDSLAFYSAIKETEHISDDGEVLMLPPYYPADCSYIDYFSNEQKS